MQSFPENGEPSLLFLKTKDVSLDLFQNVVLWCGTRNSLLTLHPSWPGKQEVLSNPLTSSASRKSWEINVLLPVQNN